MGKKILQSVWLHSEHTNECVAACWQRWLILAWSASHSEQIGRLWGTLLIPVANHDPVLPPRSAQAQLSYTQKHTAQKNRHTTEHPALIHCRENHIKAPVTQRKGGWLQTMHQIMSKNSGCYQLCEHFVWKEKCILLETTSWFDSRYVPRHF